jgi:hypothetical protein
MTREDWTDFVGPKMAVLPKAIDAAGNQYK